MMEADETPWWRDAVLYQIYPRSFQDSNGDGIGDLRGIVERLDHLEWLGVDGIWLNPVMDSPNKDWGYDISNFKGVHPELGTHDDVRLLVEEASRRRIRVIFDLVPNHTSDQHPWFQDALSGREAQHRDWYVWADPKPDGGLPNNWVSVFGGEAAWELDPSSGQYYLHNFLKHQPDLNWWNDGVRDAFDDILRFWFDRGIAGFRIDVAHALVKDRELRDNAPSTEDDHPGIRRLGQRAEYNMNRPEVHDIFRRWRALCDSYESKRILIGETYVMDIREMSTYYGDGDDELNLAFNFPFVLSDFDPTMLRNIVETSERLIPPRGWPVWFLSNHDVGRFASRWCEDEEVKARCCLVMLMGMRGTPFLYYGDELAMRHVELWREDIKDPVGVRFWPEQRGRDPARTPMRWSPGSGAGFTSGKAAPWLPLGNDHGRNVESQRGDPHSVVNLCRDLIRLRRANADLRRSAYEPLESEQAWAWRRGRFVVAVNLSDADDFLDDVTGRVSISTGRDRDGEKVARGASLRPWEGLILEAR
jgi:alpha-glucosidase